MCCPPATCAVADSVPFPCTTLHIVMLVFFEQTFFLNRGREAALYENSGGTSYMKVLRKIKMTMQPLDFTKRTLT